MATARRRVASRALASNRSKTVITAAVAGGTCSVGRDPSDWQAANALSVFLNYDIRDMIGKADTSAVIRKERYISPLTPFYNTNSDTLKRCSVVDFIQSENPHNLDIDYQFERCFAFIWPYTVDFDG